jgi:hypothetical protein
MNGLTSEPERGAGTIFFNKKENKEYDMEETCSMHGGDRVSE